MLQASEGLTRYVGVPLVDSDFTIPPWPGRRRLGWAVLAAAILWLVDRRARSTRHR